jgi:hypothetical protein
MSDAIIKKTEILIEIKERKKEDFALPINFTASFNQKKIMLFYYQYYNYSITNLTK